MGGDTKEIEEKYEPDCKQPEGVVDHVVDASRKQHVPFVYLCEEK